MLPNHADLTAGLTHHLRHQQPEPAVAEHGYPFSRIKLHLLEHLICRSQRLDEHGRVIVHTLWHHVQIRPRKPDIFGERPIVIENSQHRAIAAMRAQSRQTQVATPADNIDFPNHALTDQISIRPLTTSATNSWPRIPRKPMYPLTISRSVAQIPA